MSRPTLCIACKWGDCDNHQTGSTRKGVIGGWWCPCKHTPEERAENERRSREAFERWMGSPARSILASPAPLSSDPGDKP